ncbi:hypothetical protein ACQP2H_24140 [Micromonospora sp. CA-248260]|uniref:hypothetical protein n=1 Tax=Micromonospora sp. CA-248260 TaxID=3239962 RepID=UPI003D8A32EF
MRHLPSLARRQVGNLYLGRLSADHDLPPTSPRVDGAAYCMGLLDAMDRLAEIGAANPVQILAEAIGISPHTVKTQLPTARRRAQS